MAARILSAAAPFKAGGRGGPEYYTDVPVGDVAIKNVADLYLYPNTVRAVKVTGAEVKDWLERSAGMFNQVEPGKADQVLLNPDFPSYNFDVIDGVTLLNTEFQGRTLDGDGNEVEAGSGRQFVSEDLRLFFFGEAWDDATPSDVIDMSPLEFIFPGEAGFFSDTPKYECNQTEASF